MTPQSNPIQRRYDLDWLRVFAILSVFFYHSTRFFNQYDWHVKSPVVYPGVDLLQRFAESWMMPLIFLISGASIFFAMGKGGSVADFKDKLLRLGVPLIVCVFTHASIQVYLDRLTHYQFFGSYFAFLPQYFQGIYLDGNPAAGNFALFGMHLWYLLVLLAYSALFYPLFAWLKAGGKRVLEITGNFLAFPGVIYLLAIPTLLFLDFIENSPLGDLAPGGWPIPAYIPFLLAGFILVSNARLQARIQKSRWISLGIGIAFTAVYIFWAFQPLLRPDPRRPQRTPFQHHVLGLDPGFHGLCRPPAELYQPLLEIRQRSRAALLYPAPDRAARGGLLHLAVANPRLCAVVSHHLHQLCRHPARLRIPRAPVQPDALPVRDETGHEDLRYGLPGICPCT